MASLQGLPGSRFGPRVLTPEICLDLGMDHLEFVKDRPARFPPCKLRQKVLWAMAWAVGLFFILHSFAQAALFEVHTEEGKRRTSAGDTVVPGESSQASGKVADGEKEYLLSRSGDYQRTQGPTCLPHETPLFALAPRAGR